MSKVLYTPEVLRVKIALLPSDARAVERFCDLLRHLLILKLNPAFGEALVLVASGFLPPARKGLVLFSEVQPRHLPELREQVLHLLRPHVRRNLFHSRSSRAKRRARSAARRTRATYTTPRLANASLNDAARFSARSVAVAADFAADIAENCLRRRVLRTLVATA